ncbi:MAG: hypothetical protein Q8P22_02015 [Chloroflexota bacterium]|nr:hypothetical protein [Chloroflexota bacterium]
MKEVDGKEALLVVLGAMTLATLVYGSVVGNVWALMVATYVAAVLLIVWLGARRSSGRR